MSFFKKHIDLLEAVNNSKNQAEHDLAYYRLVGFREAMDCFGLNQLMQCDLHYLNQGIERSMCCGVWLDWEPSAQH